MMRLLQRLCFLLSAMLLFVEVAAQPQATHKVLRKETAYGIARTYGVDLNALFELNPWAESGIRKGDVLRLPQAPRATDVAKPEVSPGVQISQEAQDSLPGTAVEPESGQQGVGVDEVFGAVDAISRARPFPPTWSLDTVRIAVFLPFFSGRDSLSRQEARLREIAEDCAAGIRLALDDDQRLGAHLEVRFLDTGRDTSGGLMCSPQDLEGLNGPVHIAMGPLKRSQFFEVRTWPGMEGAVHVALTDLGARLAAGRPGVLMPYSQVAKRMEVLAQHVALQHRGERVLLLVTGDIRNLDAESAFREAWSHQAAADSLLVLSEVEVASRGLGTLRDSLTDVRRNILVVPGGKANRSFAGVLQTEIQLGDSLDFVVYADGDWKKFDFLDADLRERVGFTVVDGGGALPDSSFFGALDSSHFCLARQLSKLRGGPAGGYGWMSFDVLRDALNWTLAHGPEWPVVLAQGGRPLRTWNIPENGQFTFEWQAAEGSGGGLVNGAVRLMRQEDFKWVELNPSEMGVPVKNNEH